MDNVQFTFRLVKCLQELISLGIFDSL